MTRILSFLLLFLPLTAHAAPAEVSLLPGWRMEGARHMAALRIRLDDGWKTYWRAPGEAGIPPLFDWSGSQNLTGVTIHWPAPQVFQNGGMRVIAYRDELILPLELHLADPDAPLNLQLSADFGVCHDICIPMQAALQADLNAAKSRDPAIIAALMDQPEPGSAKMRCTIAPTPGGLRISITAPHPPADAVIELSDPGAWIGEPVVRAEGRGLRAEAEVQGQGIAVDRTSLRMTLLPENGDAVEYVGCE